MKHTRPDPRPTRSRARALPRWPLAAFVLAPLLIAACEGDVTATCPALAHPPVLTVAAADNPSPRVRPVVTGFPMSTDPCAGQPTDHIVTWFSRQGTRYPLRCGRRDPRGFGYLHIRYDEGGHGDPVNDLVFRAEMANTLEHGIERLASGGTWRYTVKYDDFHASCFNARYFRVVLARSPNLPDGYPAGIITALFYANQPDQYP